MAYRESYAHATTCGPDIARAIKKKGDLDRRVARRHQAND